MSKINIKIFILLKNQFFIFKKIDFYIYRMFYYFNIMVNKMETHIPDPKSVKEGFKHFLNIYDNIKKNKDTWFDRYKKEDLSKHIYNK